MNNRDSSFQILYDALRRWYFACPDKDEGSLFDFVYNAVVDKTSYMAKEHRILGYRKAIEYFSDRYPVDMFPRLSEELIKHLVYDKRPLPDKSNVEEE